MGTFRTKPLSRRMMLRGLGAAISLPFLEAMLPHRGGVAFAAENTPLRMLAYYVPNGIHMQSWTPAQEGVAFMPSGILAPLAPVKDDVLVLTGLENKPARPDGPGDHASGTGAFLTVRHPRKTAGTDIQNGISVDQVAANALKDQTKFASIQLGMDGGGSDGNCDSGYSCAYARNISWAGEKTPLPKITDVRRAFDYLFAGFDPDASAEAVARRRAYGKSVLDYVREDARRLQEQVGKTDKQKLDEYLTGVRELERRVEQDENGPVCAQPSEPGAPTSVASKARAMADIMTAAFECDLTRVISFMLANAGSGRNYQNEPGVNVSGNHHQISHHESRQDNYNKLIAINTWEVQQFTYLLERLKEKTDVTGNTLLHNSAIFFSSEISDGNRHNHNNMPVLLAGHGGGAFTPGRHVRYQGDPSVANLFLSMLGSVGVAVDSFGMDSTGPLPQLKL